jgi:hypothetical protein
MFNTDNSVFSFLAWWKQGLLNPLPRAKVSRVVLLVVDHVLCDSSGKKLSQQSIDQLQGESKLYLLAASKKVMSKGISEAQRGLPLWLVAEEILPFNASELFIAKSDDGDHIHFVVRSDLDLQLRIFEASGLGCSGVAFDIPGRRQFVALDSQALRGTARVPKLRLAGLILVTVGIVAGAGVMSYAAGQKQEALDYQLTQLKQQVSILQGDGSQTHSIADKIKTRDAKQVVSALKAIAESLPEEAIIDQLILSDNDLVIDASALSATQVQANLDSSQAFQASEFITTISRSTTEDRERFRLKLSINEVR